MKIKDAALLLIVALLGAALVGAVIGADFIAMLVCFGSAFGGGVLAAFAFAKSPEELKGELKNE